MKKGVGTRENRERAYRLYREHGGRDIRAVLGKLQSRYGLKISAQTLYKWRREGKWTDRMAEGEPESFDLGMFGRLVRLIEKYEGYLEGKAGVDNQAAYAYTNMIRTAMELSARIGPARTDPEEMKRIAEEILETEYGIKRT